MLVIPLKVSKQIDIASPLLEWVIHQEKKNQTHLPPPIASAKDDNQDLLPDSSQNHLSENNNANNYKNVSDASKVNPNGIPLKENLVDSKPSGNSSSYPSSQEAQEGLIHISSLREYLTMAMNNREIRTDAEMGDKILNSAMEYHASLLECENRGFPTKDGEIHYLHLEWECAFDEDREPLARSNILFERAAILFNVGALESYIASREDMSARRGLTAAVNRYNMAASIFSHIRTELLPKFASSSDPNFHNTLTLDLTPSCLKMCENMLLAQGQACMYEMARVRPMHNVLAKISMGAAEIYNEALFSSQDRIVRAQMTNVEKWSAHFQAMSMIFRARAEYHESICAREGANKQGKLGHGLEIARLTMAEKLCEKAIIFGKQSYFDLKVIDELKLAVMERKSQAEDENNNIHKEKIPSSREVEPTRGQRMSKIVPLKKNLSVLPKPLFRSGLSPHARISVDRYRAESKEILLRCTNLAERETEAARNALAKVNLPQSLTSYNATKQGIPHHIWQKVEASQHASEIERLKEGLWGLKELSDNVHQMANEVNEQLEEDFTLDTEFRNKYISFNGHDVGQVQQATRRSMEQCGKLLANAKKGDTVLLQYLQKFESDPKFKVLQYNKQQLDSLNPLSNKAGEVDTSTLSRSLVELSSLIHERELLLQCLNQENDCFDIKGHVASLEANETPETINAFEKLIDEKLMSYKQIQHEIDNNIEKQPQLLYTVLTENETFVQSRSPANVSAAGQNFVHMIEEGLHILKIVKKQLEDGRNFYNMIVPRLKQLKQHVSFMSVRLAVQRFDYEDNARATNERMKQEVEDEKMAKTLAMKNGQDNSSNIETIYDPMPQSQRFGNDYRESSIQNDPRNSASASSPSYPLSQSGGLPQPPIRRDSSNEPIPRTPHQPGSDSMHAYLHETPPNRSTSIGSSNRPLPHAPLSLPSARSSSMSSFGRPPQRTDDGVYQPPSYLSQPPSAGQPGIYYQSNFKPPPIRVDDEKVARLVAMDFDPEKVVISLQKYDNNFDQALNDLLSC